MFYHRPSPSPLSPFSRVLLKTHGGAYHAAFQKVRSMSHGVIVLRSWTGVVEAGLDIYILRVVLS